MIKKQRAAGDPAQPTGPSKIERIKSILRTASSPATAYSIVMALETWAASRVYEDRQADARSRHDH